MDTIKGTMTEIYNDLSKSTSGNTIAEVILNFRPVLITCAKRMHHFLISMYFFFPIDSPVKDRDREAPVAASTRVIRDEAQSW